MIPAPSFGHSSRSWHELPSSPRLMLTLIVPTYNEGKNTEALVSAVSEFLLGSGNRTFEILFIDDSTDDTPLLLEHLSKESPHVRYLHRQGERGLGSAIVRGFKEARGSVLAVMDGDLQHPPALLPAMLAQIEKGADLVIPSRFIPGGNDGGLTPSRKIVSLVARSIARLMFSRIRPTSDPTSGVFMMRRDVIDGIRFDAGSWKVLVEILVLGCYGPVVELPYRFRARDLGSSKMSFKAQWEYLRHLLRLRSGRGPGNRERPCQKTPSFTRRTANDLKGFPALD